MDVCIEIDTSARKHAVKGTLLLDSRWGAEHWRNLDGFFNSLLLIYGRAGFDGSDGIGQFDWGSPSDTGIFREFSLIVGSVHESFWRVLAGGLLARGAVGLRLVEHSRYQEGLDWKALMQLSRFAAPHPLPFIEQVIENPKWRDDRTIQWVFRQPLKDTVVVQVYGAIANWNELLNGGFPPSGSSPMESVSIGGAPYQVDRYTVEHRVHHWSCDLEAFELLFSVARFFHRTNTPLDELIVE